MQDDATHLLSELGILSQFSIVKKISKKEFLQTSKKIKKIYKNKSPESIKKLVEDTLIDNVKQYLLNKTPPGIIIPKSSIKKQKLDKYYLELSKISQVLTQKFVDQKLTKQQVCFIINFLINSLGIGEYDFEKFHKDFQKYKSENFDENEDEDKDES